MTMISQGLKVMRKQGFWSFFNNIMVYVYSFYLSAILMPFMVRKFRTANKNADNIIDAVRLAFSFRFLGLSIQPLQLRDEISKLMEIIAELKPKCILEIGTYFGGTLFLFSKVATSDAVIISLDLINQKYRQPLYKNYEVLQEIKLLTEVLRF